MLSVTRFVSDPRLRAGRRAAGASGRIAESRGGPATDGPTRPD